jgi:hypothetical protein
VPRDPRTRLVATARIVPRSGCDHHRVVSASTLRLLDSAAATALLPLGLVRLDGSSTWVDDHGWWVVGVDFETAGRGRGTRLVLFADFLWHGRDRLVRSVAARIRERGRLLDQDGIELECAERTGADVQDLAAGLAGRAAAELRSWREGFPTLRSWAAYLDGSAEEGGLWREYDAGVAAGLAGDGERARHWFGSVLGRPIRPLLYPDHDQDSIVDAQRSARDLVDRLDRPDAFRAAVAGRAATMRRGLGLAEREL